MYKLHYTNSLYFNFKRCLYGYGIFISPLYKSLLERLKCLFTYDHKNVYERQKRRCYHLLLLIILFPLKLSKQISNQLIKKKTNFINHQINQNGKNRKYINNLNINQPPRYGWHGLRLDPPLQTCRSRRIFPCFPFLLLYHTCYGYRRYLLYL